MEARRHRRWLGSTRHEICTAGEACQGGGVPARLRRLARAGLWQCAGALRGPDRPVMRPETAPIASAPGRMPAGARRVTSIA